LGLFPVHGSDEQIFGVNDEEPEKTYRQRGAISWPPSKK